MIAHLTTEYRATFPTILIEVARWLVSRFQGILFKRLVGSSVDSKVYSRRATKSYTFLVLQSLKATGEPASR